MKQFKRFALFLLLSGLAFVSGAQKFVYNRISKAELFRHTYALSTDKALLALPSYGYVSLWSLKCYKELRKIPCGTEVERICFINDTTLAVLTENEVQFRSCTDGSLINVVTGKYDDVIRGRRDDEFFLCQVDEKASKENKAFILKFSFLAGVPALADKYSVTSASTFYGSRLKLELSPSKNLISLYDPYEFIVVDVESGKPKNHIVYSERHLGVISKFCFVSDQEVFACDGHHIFHYDLKNEQLLDSTNGWSPIMQNGNLSYIRNDESIVVTGPQNSIKTEYPLKVTSAQYLMGAEMISEMEVLVLRSNGFTIENTLSGEVLLFAGDPEILTKPSMNAAIADSLTERFYSDRGLLNMIDDCIYFTNTNQMLVEASNSMTSYSFEEDAFGLRKIFVPQTGSFFYIKTNYLENAKNDGARVYCTFDEVWIIDLKGPRLLGPLHTPDRALGGYDLEDKDNGWVIPFTVYNDGSIIVTADNLNQKMDYAESFFDNNHCRIYGRKDYAFLGEYYQSFIASNNKGNILVRGDSSYQIIDIINKKIISEFASIDLYYEGLSSDKQTLIFNKEGTFIFVKFGDGSVVSRINGDVELVHLGESGNLVCVPREGHDRIIIFNIYDTIQREILLDNYCRTEDVHVDPSEKYIVAVMDTSILEVERQRASIYEFSTGTKTDQIWMIQDGLLSDRICDVIILNNELIYIRKKDQQYKSVTMPSEFLDYDGVQDLRFLKVFDMRFLALIRGGNIEVWDIYLKKKYCSYPIEDHNVEPLLHFSNDGRFFYYAQSNKVFTYDLVSGRQAGLLTLQSVCNGFRFIMGGKFLLSCEDALKIYDSKGTLLATVSSNERGEPFSGKNAIIFTPDGRFDGTPDAMKLGYYTNGLDIIPLESLFEVFYTPKLLERVLAGEVFSPLPFDIAKLQAKPSVRIIYPAGDDRGTKVTGLNVQSQKKTVAVSVEATDQGGGVDEIRLYANGKLVESTERGIVQKFAGETKTERTFSVELVAGDNLIRAVAVNRQRTESDPDEIVISYTGASAKSDLYLLSVGIDKYRNPKHALNYAVADAGGFKLALEEGAQGIFSEIHSVLITDADATKPAILKAIGDIQASARPEDVFIFYYAGHGVMSEEAVAKFYLVPCDVTQLYGDNRMLADKGISDSLIMSLSSQLKARKQLYVFDACQSGSLANALAARGAAEEKAIAQLARSTGTYWLMASAADQFASEFAELKHGLFTYTLLLGLQGQADGAPVDQQVTVEEISAFVKSMLPVLSEKYKGLPQYPNSYGYGTDFPIVIIRR